MEGKVLPSLSARIFKLPLGKFFVLVMVISFMFSFSPTLAAPTRLLNYQARITDPSGESVSDGSYSIVFRIYNVASGGSALWTETNEVSLEDGILDVRLGNSTPINLDFNTGTYYLGVTIEDDSELSPRRPIGAAPFALNSSLLDGRPIGTGPNDVLALDNSSNLNLPNNLNTNGNTAIGGNATIDGSLTSGLVNTSFVTLGTSSIGGTNGRIRFTGTDFEGFFGGVWHSLTAAGSGTTINGTPTPGQVVVVDASSDPTFTTITGAISFSSTGVTTINANSVTLGTQTIGDYVAGVLNGSGITVTGSGGEASTPTVSLGPLTSNWNQTGAFDIVLNNAGSELRILESVGGTFFGTVDVGDLSADRTYVLPNENGTICTTGSVCSGYAPATGSTVYATRQLDNLTGVAINTSLLPNSNDTHNLGSDSLRWQDIYLGPGTMHIGTSIADEASFSFDTAADELELAFNGGGTPSLTVSDTGNFVHGSSALATTATDGFLYFPQTSGTPTGTPTSYTGRVPITWDATGNTLYIYEGGTWNAISGGGGGVSGTGVAGQATFWTGTSTIAGDTEFLYSSTSNRLRLGSASADSGTLSLPNNSGIHARNAANTADVLMLYLTTANGIGIGPTSGFTTDVDINAPGGSGSTTLNLQNSESPGILTTRFEGNVEVHGTDGFGTVATSGIIRLPNASSITGRNSSDSANIPMISVDSNDMLRLGPTSGFTTDLDFQNPSGSGSSTINMQNSEGTNVANLRLEGHLQVHDDDGFGTVATTGTIRLPNASSIVARNAADSANITAIAVDSNDMIRLGPTSGFTTDLDFQNPSGSGAYTLNVQNSEGTNVVNVNIEGELTVYDTDALAGAGIVTISTAGIVPGSDDTYDLGATGSRFRDLYLGPGSLHVGTSTGDEGSIFFNTTNDELNIAVDGTTRLLVSDTGNIVQGTGSLSTSATNGFPYMPSMAGVPTGTPTSYSGRVPMTYNTASNILYVYNSGWQAINGGGGGITGTGAAGRVTIWSGASAVTSDAEYLWDSTNNILTLGMMTIDSDTLTTTFNILNNGSTTNYRFQNSDLGDVSDIELEGTLEIFNSDGFGSSPAASGAIRLPNNRSLSMRNAANTADINAIKVATNDRIVLGPTSTNQTDFDLVANAQTTYRFTNSDIGSGADINIEGVLRVFDSDDFAGAVAGSGAIRLQNTDTISARNAANSADISLISLDTNNYLVLGPTSGTTQTSFNLNAVGTTEFIFRNSHTSHVADVTIEGVLNVYDDGNFADPISTTGIINIPNNQSISTRDSANTVDLNIIKINTNEHVVIGPTSGADVTQFDLLSNGTESQYIFSNMDDGSRSDVQIEGVLKVYDDDTDTGGDPLAGIAQSGVIRIGNNRSISARNTANSADINLITLKNNDNIVLGPTSTTGADSVTFDLEENGLDTQFRFNNTDLGNVADIQIEGGLTVYDSDAFAGAGVVTISSAGIIPGSDDTYDLGSSTNRFRDLYLGPGTLHIGTTTSTDEGTIAYDTANNELELSVNGSNRIVIEAPGAEAEINMLLGTGTSDLVIGTDVDTPGFSIIRSTVGSGISFYGAGDVQSLTISRTTSDVMIGDGTISSHKLTVIGTASEEGIYLNNPTAGIDLQISPDTDTSGYMTFRTTTGTGLTFYGADDVNALTILRSNSNVGINCIDPDNDLEVGGTGAGCNTGTRSFMNAGDTAWSNSSSRTIKENFNLVSGSDILEKISAVPVYTYDFKQEFCTSEHCTDRMGLIAEDFYTVFKRGDNKTLNGHEVTMALWLATQELYKEFKNLKVTDIKEEMDDIKIAITDIKGEIVSLKSEVAGIKDRLNNLEDSITKKNVPVTEGATEYKVEWPTPFAGSDYGAWVTPNWNAGLWITDKLPTSFVVKFANPAPAEAKLDYKISK